MILIDKLEDVENYKSMFPDSYTSIQQIKTHAHTIFKYVGIWKT